ncbi:MAG TPA: hypothetical protein VLQ89_03845, partial [Candidatus Binatia bacterium]|nr:hypothetical protein [Candidatus Binatia bacterium]
LHREMKSLYNASLKTVDRDMVKMNLHNAGTTFRLDRISAGVASATLAPRPGEPLSPAFVATTGRWQALKARESFLAGDTAAGVQRLRELGYFLLDAEAGANGMEDYAQAVGLFRVFCQEVVSLALAQDIDPAAKQWDKLEPLLLLFLKKMNSRRAFQMAYLDDLDTVRREDFADSWWTGPPYFWFGRLRFLAEKSTRNLVLFRILAAASRGRNALAAVSRPEEIIGILARFRHDDGKAWPQIGSAAFTALQHSLRADRTLVKLALLLERLQRFGVNDNPVVSLLLSDLGKNELSNEPWKIVQRDETYVVRLTERSEFAIRPIAYASGHAAIIAELEDIAAAIGATKVL